MICWKRIFLRKNRYYSVGSRLSLWEQEYTLQTQLQGLGEPIKITLPDDTIIIGEKGITTPHSIALKISSGLAKESIIAQSGNGELLEMSVPLVRDINRLTFLKFDSDAGKQTLWHSSAHILGQAIELYYEQKGGASLADGPALLNHHAGGFFYDFLIHSEHLSVGPDDVQQILEICQKIIKEKQEFKKLRVTKEKAIEFFSHNPLKLELIERIPPGDPITLYKCGPFIDLCRGPHISNTAEASYFDITSFAPSLWQKNDGKSLTLQRIYGISFKDKKLLKQWKEFREEAAKRDHRLIGKQQQLFMFSPLSPGSAFILPMGARIYNTLISFIKSKYIKYGFQEVITPILYHSDLWKRSGHWDHYKEDMFFVNCDKDSVISPESDQSSLSANHTHTSSCNHTKNDDNHSLGLKPMNCPAHCLIFASAAHSWRDLPVKYADFSPLHRHESSGSLKGLTRLRRFVQDDAHIFCRLDQIKSVIRECLEFLSDVYRALNFQYRVVLSTRPDVFMGSIEKWNEAEEDLKIPYEINSKDGAFYGPKIDIMIKDALEREHQCGTIQLDFQLPLRFNLSFVNKERNNETPILIHRAMLGSIERIFAVLIEHNAGKWPFWLSPRQAIINTISPDCIDYAIEVKKEIERKGFFVETNFSDDTIDKKIRTSQVEQFNYILVVGKKERDSNTINVRTRDNQVHGAKSMNELIQEWEQKRINYE